jgi:hypothetical protein
MKMFHRARGSADPPASVKTRDREIPQRKYGPLLAYFMKSGMEGLLFLTWMTRIFGLL